MTLRGIAVPLGLVLSLAVSACASSPAIHFVTLHVVPSGRPGTSTGGRPALAVGRISLPPELDRSELVRRSGDDTLNVDDVYRWAAPLGVLVQRTLASDLASRLPNRLVVLPGEPQPSGGVEVVVLTFRTFSLGPDNQVLLSARWTLANGQSKEPLVTDDVRVTAQAASSSGADVAEAMSAALAKLADAVAPQLAGR